jgi:hypothetical protein
MTSLMTDEHRFRLFGAEVLIKCKNQNFGRRQVPSFLIMKQDLGRAKPLGRSKYTNFRPAVTDKSHSILLGPFSSDFPPIFLR